MEDKKYSRIFSFRIPGDIDKMLSEMAEKTNRSVNSMLIECVMYYFKNVFKK